MEPDLKEVNDALWGIEMCTQREDLRQQRNEAEDNAWKWQKRTMLWQDLTVVSIVIAVFGWLR